MPTIPEKKEYHEEWFEIPDDPDKGRVLVRHLEEDDFLEVKDQAHQKVWVPDPDNAAMLTMELRVNGKLDREMTLCLAVKGWENFFKQEKKGGAKIALECTDENKIWYARRDPSFLSFLVRCRQKLAVDYAKKQDAARKN